MDKINKILLKIQKITSNITDKELNEKIKKYEDNFDNVYIKIAFPQKMELLVSKKYSLNQSSNYKIVNNDEKCDFEEDEIWKISRAV